MRKVISASISIIKAEKFMDESEACKMIIGSMIQDAKADGNNLLAEALKPSLDYWCKQYHLYASIVTKFYRGDK